MSMMLSSKVLNVLFILSRYVVIIRVLSMFKCRMFSMNSIVWQIFSMIIPLIR